MNNLQKVGGYAAFAAGVANVALYVIVLVFIVPVGWSADTPPDKALAAMATILTPFNLTNLMVVVFSVTLIPIALAVGERLQAGAPERMRLAVIAASIGAALFLGFGTTAFTGFPMLLAAKDATAYRAFGAVLQGLGSGANFACGCTYLLWGWAGLSTKGLPRLLNYVLLLAGVMGVLAFLIPPFGSLTGLLTIVWSFWLGFVLLRPAPVMSTMGTGKS